MNEYELIFDVKKKIEQEIRKHKLFLLKKEEAVFTVFEKFGVLFRIYFTDSNMQIQNHLRTKVKTNVTYIDQTVFMQESLKWICRWIDEFCDDDKQSNQHEKVMADEIFDLMGQAYCYDQLDRMMKLHSAHYVRYQKLNNKIIFDYINSEVCDVHVAYDSIIKEAIAKEDIAVFKSKKYKSDEEMMDDIQSSDFSFEYNFQFDGFCMDEYKIFAVELNKIAVEDMKAKNGIKLVIPGQEGIISYPKQMWIDIMHEKTGLTEMTVESIIDFFTYKHGKKSDLSLTYFMMDDTEKLMLSVGIFYMQRPAVNALRVLAKGDKEQRNSYNSQQNNLEQMQRRRFGCKLGSRYRIPVYLTREQEIRPGMDMLVYDPENNYLQIIELKYKLPIDSAQDYVSLEELLNKAYRQLERSKEIVDENKKHLLEEYFGEEYKGIIPEKIDYFVLTNDSVGMGGDINLNLRLPTPIMLEKQYFALMQYKNGMERVHDVLLDKNKGCITRIEKRYARLTFAGYKILIPEYKYWNKSIYGE